MMRPTPFQIREARQAAGLSQAAAAKLIGYSWRTWQGYESGERSMRAFIWDVWKKALAQQRKDAP